MTTNPPEDTPEPGAYPPPDSPTTPPTAPGYQAPGQGQTPPPGYGQVPPGYSQPTGYGQASGYGQTPPPGYGPTPPPYGQPGYAAPLSPSDERLWATLAHLSGFLSIVATVVIWAVFKERGPFVRDQSTEALNFQITVVVAGFAVGIISVLTAGLGAILYLAFIAAIVFMILGAVAANRGETYRYPLNWRVIK